MIETFLSDFKEEIMNDGSDIGLEKEGWPCNRESLSEFNRQQWWMIQDSINR